MAGNYTLDSSKYLLNGINFSAFGAYVEQSSGFLDEPKRKAVLQYSWPEEHGIDMDLSAGFFVEPKYPKLVIGLVGTNYLDLQAKRKLLIAQLRRAGYQYIKMAGIPFLSLAVLNDQVTFEMLTNINASPCMAKVTLSFMEPYPVNQQFYADLAAPGSSSLALNVSKPVIVDWGDGSFGYADVGASIVSHNYANAGNYCIVLYPGDGILSVIPTGATEISYVVEPDTGTTTPNANTLPAKMPFMLTASQVSSQFPYTLPFKLN